MRAKIQRSLVSLALVAVPLTVCAASRPTIEVGDTMEEVHDVLGRPDGHIRSGSFTLLYFDRGKIELADGVVTDVNLVSAERAAELREERHRRAREHRAALQERGRAVRDDRLDDPAFLAQPASEQLEFWQRFRRRYPTVRLEQVDLDGLVRRKQEQREAQLEQELLAAKWRRIEAEERAQEARLAAQRAERAHSRSYSYLYPPRIVTFRRSCDPPRKRVAPCTQQPQVRITTVDPYAKPLSGIELSAEANAFHSTPRLGARWTFPNPLRQW